MPSEEGKIGKCVTNDRRDDARYHVGKLDMMSKSFVFRFVEFGNLIVLFVTISIALR